ncbi:hypothetical protein LINGRAHAP2_LOCUS24934 [Linum grandiflorum]
MADAEDVGEEGSIFSSLGKSLESSQNVDSISTEDVAWADSCLVKDPDISNGEWSSVKGSLLEMLSLIPDSSAGDTMDHSLGAEGTDVEMLSPDEPALNEQPPPSGSSRGNDRFRMTIGGETLEEIDLSILSKEEMDALSLLSYLVQDPMTFDGNFNFMKEAVERILSLRPNESNTLRLVHEDGAAQSSAGTDTDQTPAGHETTTKENDFELVGEAVDRRVLKDGQLPADTTSSTQEAEQQPTTVGIFKLWDLCIPDEEEEEDGLITQLKKALSGSSARSTGNNDNNDADAWKDIKEGALDHLINGFGDLSIQHDSS